MSKKFLVVEFLGYNSVEVVPHSWVSSSEQGQFVYWPKYDGAVKAKRYELPDKAKWKLFQIREFYSTDNYERAVHLSRKAEVTSNLETEEEEEQINGRKRKKPTRFQDDSGSDSGDNGDTEQPSAARRKKVSGYSQSFTARRDPVLPPPPALSSRDRPPAHSSPALPQPPASLSTESQDQLSRRSSPALPQSADRRDRDLPPPYGCNPALSSVDSAISAPHSIPDFQYTLDDPPAKDEIAETEIPMPTSPLYSGLLSIHDSFDDGPQPGSSRASTPRQFLKQRKEPRENGFQMNVLMRLLKIEQQVQEQNSMLRTLITNISVTHDDTEEDILSKPLDTEEELTDLNEKLSNKMFRKKMILYLSSLGGNDIGDCIRRMLRKLGSNKLWSSYSYKGRKNQKKAFQNLKLSGVIKKAYIRTHPKAQEKDIEDQISSTLKGAPFKKGGVQSAKTVEVPAATVNRVESSEDNVDSDI